MRHSVMATASAPALRKARATPTTPSPVTTSPRPVSQAES